MPANLPPFSPAARPAWKPMQVVPNFRKTAGITVFGTRLTYRQAAIGAAALLVIVVLVIVLAVKAFGGGGGDKQAGSPTRPATAGATGDTAGNGVPAKSGDATKNGAGATTKPAVTSTPTKAATGASAVTLPAGWKWFNRPTQGAWPGFSIPIPQNASIDPQGSELYIRWNNRLLLVDRTNSPQSDVVQDWKDQERGRHLRDYQKIKIVPVDCPFKACADWEFFYTTENGNAQHADKRNILVSGSAAYSVNWYTTPDDWGPSQTELRLIYQGFQPKP